MTTTGQLRNAIDLQKGQRQEAISQIAILREKVTRAEEDKRIAEDAQTVIQIVAQQTQGELEFHLSELVSLGMADVFGPDAYGFKMTFEIKRGKTECESKFLRDGSERDPLGTSSGGGIDLSGLTLRAAVLILEKGKQKILLLDEPLKFLSVKYRKRAGEMMAELAKEHQIQIIISTHIQEFIESADRVFLLEGGKVKVSNKERSQPKPLPEEPTKRRRRRRTS